MDQAFESSTQNLSQRRNASKRPKGSDLEISGARSSRLTTHQPNDHEKVARSHINCSANLRPVRPVTSENWTHRTLWTHVCVQNGWLGTRFLAALPDFRLAA